MGACFSAPAPPPASAGKPMVHLEGEPIATAAAPATAASKPVNPLVPKSEEEFKKKYLLRGVLGEGSYSVVRKASDLEHTGALAAVKVVDRKKLTAEDEIALKLEVQILSALHHDNVIRLYDWYASPGTYFLALEFMQGGELFERIVKREFYSEFDAKQVVLTLTKVLRYLHVEHGIAHRDLKPENILLTDNTDAAQIKIADFGFARKFGQNELTSACGTPGYVAPEIISGKAYGASVDVWSLGVITYILLCGYPPFYNSNQKELFKQIREGRYKFESPYWDPVSDEAKRFIQDCLQVDVGQRLDVDGMLASPWLAAEFAADAQKQALTKARDELKKFNARRKLRAAVKAAIAANRLADIAKGVRDVVAAQQVATNKSTF